MCMFVSWELKVAFLLGAMGKTNVISLPVKAPRGMERFSAGLGLVSSTLSSDCMHSYMRLSWLLLVNARVIFHFTWKGDKHLQQAPMLFMLRIPYVFIFIAFACVYACKISFLFVLGGIGLVDSTRSLVRSVRSRDVKGSLSAVSYLLRLAL